MKDSTSREWYSKSTLETVTHLRGDYPVPARPHIPESTGHFSAVGRISCSFAIDSSSRSLTKGRQSTLVPGTRALQLV
ncbi:MAG: hypothetical protein OXT09_36375, partial [Myxococcales bacterium]|nr:hypothetical protein [Myxococcales bacterium]